MERLPGSSIVGIEWWGELEKFEGPSTGEFVATVTSPFWGAAAVFGGSTAVADFAPMVVASGPGWQPLARLFQRGVDTACADADCGNEAKAIQSSSKVVDFTRSLQGFGQYPGVMDDCLRGN